MNNPHTPGPWTVEKDIDSTPSYATFRIGLSTTQSAISSEKGITCSNSNVLMSVAEAEANARLISAAPELLEQLKEARQYVAKVAAEAISPVFANRRLRDMELAIAKAEGGAA